MAHRSAAVFTRRVGILTIYRGWLIGYMNARREMLLVCLSIGFYWLRWGDLSVYPENRAAQRMVLFLLPMTSPAYWR